MKAVQQLILYCLNSDPEQRPFIDDLISRIKDIQHSP